MQADSSGELITGDVSLYYNSLMKVWHHRLRSQSNKGSIRRIHQLSYWCSEGELLCLRYVAVKFEAKL